MPKRKQNDFWMKLRRWLSVSAPSTEFATLPSDGKPWDVSPVPNRVVAIGDLEGDLGALATILEDRGLISESGKWSGGAAHVVLLGDLVGGHEYSRLLVEFVIRLETEAMRSGGGVHALLGNHDLLPGQGIVKSMSSAEKDLYRRYPISGASCDKPREAFRGRTPYATWLASRNAILRIGDTLFVHAGVDRWALEVEPPRVNATIRAWIAHWQGNGPRPPEETLWAAAATDEDAKDGISPLWNRAYKVRDEDDQDRPKGAPSRKAIREILAKYGVRRIVLGHAPVPSREILLDHPYYGDTVILSDTRLSDLKRGRLSAVEIQAGRVSVAYPTRKAGHPAIGIELAKLEKLATRSGQSWFSRIIAAVRGRKG